MNKLDELIPLSEASEISGLSSDHLRRLAEQGKLKAQKIGRNWVTTRKDVEDYIQERKSPGRPKRLD